MTMALVSSVTAAQRAAGIGELTRVLTTAGEKAAAVGDDVLIARARAPFAMVEHPPELVEAFLHRFQHAAVWRHDGNCFNRAMVGVHLLDEMSGLHAGPTSDAFAGAIHVEQELDELGQLTGRFHGSTALRVQGHPDPYVVDFLHDEPLVRFAADDLPDVTQVIHPFAGTGVWGGVSHRSNWVGPPYFDGARANLTQAWNAANTRDLRPDALETMIAQVRDPASAHGPLLDNRKISVRANAEVSFD